MIVKFKRQELQKKLSDIQSISEKKTTMPVLSNFVLEVDEGQSTIYATDLEVAIRENVEVLEVETPGKLCVSSRKLYEIAKEVTGDIELKSESEEWAHIKAGKSSFKVACLSPDEYPMWPTIEKKATVNIDSKILLAMIDKTLYCSGESDTRYELNGLLVHIKADTKRMFVVGTDGHRMACVFHDIEGIESSQDAVSNDDCGDDLKMILPKKAMVELKKFLAVIDGSISFDITDNYACFFLESRQFMTKLIEGSYPNYEDVIPQGNDKNIILDRQTFIHTLRRVSLISKEKGSLVKFDVKEGILELSAMDPEVGEASDTMDVEFSGEPITIGINAKYVLDMVSAMDTNMVEIKLLGILTPSLIMEQDSDKYKCVFMPMRL